MQFPILTVSELNRQIRNWLEYEVGTVCVEGEISNLSKPSSGHFYFTLKDASAQLRCVYFRNRNLNGSESLQLGQHIVAYGKLSLYEARGDYQLIVDKVQEAGQGMLHHQFELLKKKLSALGLFEAARKKSFPRFPDAIGVVTSASSAALRDILTTLKRRFPLAPVIVYNSEVQGKQAPKQLIAAILQANEEQRCDVLILARGGGSLEDLWAFNDEELAYSITHSKIPIICGVGHETDFTIADFVADLRAATPTAAAEAATPNLLDLIASLQTLQACLAVAMTRFVKHKRLLLNHEIHKLTSPGQLVWSHWQKLDYLKIHLNKALQQTVAYKHHYLHQMTSKLNSQNPLVRIQQTRLELQTHENKLVQSMKIKINQLKQQFSNLTATLHAVSPLATLDRGYAIVNYKNKILFNSNEVAQGDIIHIRLSKGHLTAQVTGKE